MVQRDVAGAREMEPEKRDNDDGAVKLQEKKKIKITFLGGVNINIYAPQKNIFGFCHF